MAHETRLLESLAAPGKNYEVRDSAYLKARS
jgi:hypothetical protein